MSENIKIKCTSCGAPLIVDANKEVVQCEYCSTSYKVATLLNESEELRAYRISKNTEAEIEKHRIKLDKEKIGHQGMYELARKILLQKYK